MTAVGQVVAATSIPVVVSTGGGAIATFRPPPDRVRSGVQHIAAGLVFAVASTELIPQLSHDRQPVAVSLGFTLGVALLVGIRFLPARHRTVGTVESATGALAAIAIDVFVDGILIGIAFAGGSHAGVLLTVALTVELAFLGLSVADAVTGAGQSDHRAIGTTAGISLLLPIGGIAGVTVLGNLSGAAFTVVLAFATAALLYLVTEELLTEAHEQDDTPLLTSLFFAGFLALLLLSMIGE